MASKKATLPLLRGIIREIRHGNKKSPVSSTPMYAYLMEQFRKYQVTESQLCRGEREMTHLAQTYLCLLHSVRTQQELIDHYKGRGERSVEEAAALVGLQLPLTPGSH